ncbi:MAG: hypothetical protein ACR2J6_07965 [Thermoleophilaceae bacterium]
MTFGCIDIGSNTTRLLVAELDGGRLREILNRRVFTCIGASASASGEIPPEKVAETSTVTRALTAEARGLGASQIGIVGTAAIRQAPNREELERAVRAATGLRLRVLSGTEEAELSFAGACHALEHAPGRLAVVDVGGGSTEIAVGHAHRAPEWSQSLRMGSSLLCERHLRSDPPTAGEIDAACAEVDELLAGVDSPAADSAVAVGGTATSLTGLVGERLTKESLKSGLARLCALSAQETAVELGLPLERARLLPAGIAVLAGIAAWLGCALQIVRGGVREGTVLQMAGRGA